MALKISADHYNSQQVALQPLPAPRVNTALQPNAGTEFGRAFREVGDDFQRAAQRASTIEQQQQDALAKAEGTRIAATTSEQFKSVLQANAQTITDPDEFEAKTKEALRGLYDSATQNKNAAISDYARAHLEPQLIGSDRHVAALKFGKQKDRAKASVDSSFMSYSRLASEADTEEERMTARQAFGDLVGHMEGQNFLDADHAENYLTQFGEKIRQGRVARFKVGLTGDLDNLVNNATTGGAADDLFKQGLAKIDTFTDIPAAERDAMKAKFKDSLFTGAIEGKIERDPFKADEELRAGKYNELIDQQSLRFLKGKAETGIERIARQQDAIRKEQEKQIGKSVDDFKASVMNGFSWSGNVSNLAGAVRGTEHEKEFLETIRDSNELYKFGLKSVVQQEDFLRSQRSVSKSGSEAQLYNKLETLHGQTKAGLKNDPITFAIKQRALPNSLMPFDLNNPNSLKERSIAAGMVENRYGVGVSPLSDDEADKLATDMAKQPADKKAQTMRQLNQHFTPRQVQAVAAQIDKKGQGELAQAFGMSGQVPEVASRILQGMEAKRANKEVLPVGAELRDMDAAINKKLADAYKADPNALDSVRDAVKSYYAWGRWNVGDLSAKLDDKALDRAIYAVSGGVMDFNGSQTLPPRYGVDEAQMRKMIEKADFSRVLGDINAKTVLKNGRLIAVGPGLYRVTIGGSPVFDKSEKPWTLDLSR